MSERFVVTESSTSLNGGKFSPVAHVIVDKKTGVNYLALYDHRDFTHPIGITVLVDKDGKPLITR